MIDTRDFLKTKDWIKHSAAETAEFLETHFGAEPDYLTVLIGHLGASAVFEQKPSEAIFWACVYARVTRSAVDETARREMVLLLEESKRWSH